MPQQRNSAEQNGHRSMFLTVAGGALSVIIATAFIGLFLEARDSATERASNRVEIQALKGRIADIVSSYEFDRANLNERISILSSHVLSWRPNPQPQPVVIEGGPP